MILQQRQRSCGKAKFQTKKQAQTSLNYQGKRHNGFKGRIYPCPDCRGWHLTSKIYEKAKLYIGHTKFKDVELAEN